MNNFLKLSFFAIISIINMGCSEKKTSETVKISLHAPDQNNVAFKVITSNILNYEEVILKEGKLDSTGNAIIEFHLSKPVFCSLKMDDKTYYQIYLEPGYALQASLLSNAPTSAVSYAGTGAETSNYLAHTSSIWDKFYSEHSNFWGAEPEIFLNILDSLSNALTGFHDSYVDTVDLDGNLQKLLKIKNEFRLMNLKQQYKLIKSDAFKNDIPGFLKHISEEIPFETTYLNFNMMEYAMVLDLYVRTEIYSPLWAGKDVKEWESAKDQFPLLAHGDIQEGEYPEEIKEYLLAKNISYWLASEGISPALDTIYSKFKTDFSYSALIHWRRNTRNG